MNDTDPTTLALPDGRSLAIAERLLRLTDPAGAIELEIELSPAGPIVRVRAAALQVQTTGPLELDCERFELQTREGIRLATDGDLTASVAGDLDLRAAGHAHVDGKSMRLRAHRGELGLEAHDDVRVEGERVLLNS